MYSIKDKVYVYISLSHGCALCAGKYSFICSFWEDNGCSGAEFWHVCGLTLVKQCASAAQTLRPPERP